MSKASPLILAAAVAAFALTIGSCVPAHAKSATDVRKKEKKLEDVKKKIREEKKGVSEIAEKESNILAELNDINRALTEKREALMKIEVSRADTEKDVRAAGSEISRLDADRRRMRARLNQRLRAMYKMRRGSAVRALFESESTDDLGRRHKYLTMIMDSDVALIAEFERNMAELDKENAKLLALKNELNAIKSKALAEKKESEALKRGKAALLKNVKTEKKRKLKMVSELEKAAIDLTSMITKLRTTDEKTDGLTGFGAMKGRLPKPVAGSIISTYGTVKHSKFNTVTFNNGIVIKASTGTGVKNVYDGTVVFVGWLKGYGQVMIIDHGSGFFTLFAHLSRTLKDKDAKVASGDVVAEVGDTGPNSTEGLYFEIRQKGVPRDPSAWLASK